jgi:hypothetical protein
MYDVRSARSGLDKWCSAQPDRSTNFPGRGAFTSRQELFPLFSTAIRPQHFIL